MTIKECPSAEVLLQLADGQLTDQQESSLTAHVDTCTHCQGVLEQQSEPWLSAIPSDPILEKETSPQLLATLSEIKTNTLHGGTWPESRPTHPLADVLPWLEPAEDAVGMLDHYRLEKFVGRGGMGVVFRATDTVLKRTVAVKMLSPSYAPDGAARERFLREARAAASINHRNVVTVHSVSQESDLPYLVMEFVDGISLEDHLEQFGKLQPDVVAEIGRQVSAGLGAAHRSGIIHRDVKPSNIIVDSQQRCVKLTDFGLSRVLGEARITRSGTIVGTPSYIAPEVVEGNGLVDHRADLFSLGSVLYTLCSGELPFHAESVYGTMSQISRANPPSLTEVAPQTPASLIAIIDRLHCKNPAERFQSAADLENALATLSSGDTIVLTQPAITQQIVRKKSKNSTAVWSVVGVVGVLLASFVIYNVFLDPADPNVVTPGPTEPGGPVPGGPSGQGESRLVVIADGDRAEYTSLAEAIEDVEDNCIIELLDVGPYQVPDIELDFSLEVIGKAAQRSVLEFESSLSESSSTMIESDSFLSFSNVILRLVNDDVSVDEDNVPTVIFVTDEGQLELENCLVEAMGGTCLTVDGEATVTLRDSDLIATHDAIVTESWNGEIKINNCRVVAEIGIEINSTGESTISLEHVTARTENMFVVVLENEDDEENDEEDNDPAEDDPTEDDTEEKDLAAAVVDEAKTPQIEFVVQSCVLQHSMSLLAFPAEIDSSKFMHIVDWEGASNWYDGEFVIHGPDELSFAENLQQFRDFDSVGDRLSAQVEASFVMENLERPSLAAEFKELSKTAFAISSDVAVPRVDGVRIGANSR
jgi:serine/threonine protein kinase